MKVLHGFVIAALALHLLCGGSCFGQSSAPISSNVVDPPCHQHSQSPVAPAPPQPHKTDSPCGQGSLLETKVTVNAKQILLPATIFVAVAATGISLEESSPLEVRPDIFPKDLPSALSPTVLRI